MTRYLPAENKTLERCVKRETDRERERDGEEDWWKNGVRKRAGEEKRDDEVYTGKKEKKKPEKITYSVVDKNACALSVFPRPRRTRVNIRFKVSALGNLDNLDETVSWEGGRGARR